jgi:hypothetical protein
MLLDDRQYLVSIVIVVAGGACNGISDFGMGACFVSALHRKMHPANCPTSGLVTHINFRLCEQTTIKELTKSMSLDDARARFKFCGDFGDFVRGSPDVQT